MTQYFDRKTFVGLFVGFVLFGLSFGGYAIYREYSDYKTNVKPFVYALKQRALELQEQAKRAQQATKPLPQVETPK